MTAFTTPEERDAFDQTYLYVSGPTVGQREVAEQVWVASRLYFTEWLDAQKKPEGEDVKCEATLQPRTDNELRQIAVSVAGPTRFRSVYKFLADATTPEDVEQRLNAVHLAKGSLPIAREILAFLNGEDEE